MMLNFENLYDGDPGLDGLSLSGYSMGGTVDVSAPIRAASNYVVAETADVDTSVLTVSKWASRKNASFRSEAAEIAAILASIALSYKFGRKDMSGIERIGRYVAKDWKQFWIWWTGKSILTGFIFSRFMPWAEVLSGPKYRMRNI